MLNQKIDAVVILGGGLKKDKNGWRTTNFNEGDNFGCLGDRLRVPAGAFLYKNFKKINPNLLMVASGGRGQYKDVPGAPAVSSVLKKELVELGVKRGDIIIEDKSGTTYQQLKELRRLILKNNWNKIVILSNRCHLPRVAALIENVKNLEFLKRRLETKKIFLISAENVLLKYEKKKWKNIIERAYKSKLMKNRLVLEKQGIKQLKAGLYKLR